MGADHNDLFRIGDSWEVSDDVVEEAAFVRELMDRDGTLPVGRAEAVRARVAAADDHDALAFCRDQVAWADGIPGEPAVLLRQVLDGEVDAADRGATGHCQVAVDVDDVRVRVCVDDLTGSGAEWHPTRREMGLYLMRAVVDEIAFSARRGRSSRLELVKFTTQPEASA